MWTLRVNSHPFDLEFLEDMVYVQTRTAVQFEIPETITSEDAAWFRAVADVFRTGKTIFRRSGMRITGPSSPPLPRTEGAVRIEQNITVTLLGQDIALGRGVLNLPRVELVDRGRLPDDATRRIVELRPPGGEPIEVEWSVVSTTTSS